MEFIYEKDLELSVNRDGSIISALVYVPFFDEWWDVTERIIKEESKYALFISESIGQYVEDENL